MKILQTVGERWRQFKYDLTSKWALAADKDSVNDTVCEKYNNNKEKWAQFCQSHETLRGRIHWRSRPLGSFVAHGRQDVLTVAIGQPEHPGCVRAVGAGVTIKQ
ncbi:hypothetical protein HKD37_10G028489 [Glycine soja]